MNIFIFREFRVVRGLKNQDMNHEMHEPHEISDRDIENSNSILVRFVVPISGGMHGRP